MEHLLCRQPVTKFDPSCFIERNILKLIQPVYRRFLALLTTFILVSYNCQAVSDNLVIPISSASPFYAQLRNTTSSHPIQNNDLLSTVAPRHLAIEGLMPASAAQDDDLAFNYLWMQQYQEGYDSRNGGAAVGKILRMGAKALYRNYYGNGSAATMNTGDDFTSHMSNLDYHLRLSGDKINLGVAFEF